MGAHDMRSRTAGGLLAFADYLGEKGYQGHGAVKAWKIAITKVFETTANDGADWESTSLDGLDLDELTRRFHTLTGNTYKAESVAVYRRRIANAMDAQAYFIEHDRVPTFKQQPQKKTKAEQPTSPERSQRESAGEDSKVVKLPSPPADFFEFTYPLSPGRFVRMELPPSMTKREIERLCTVIQTLEEQPQLPPGDAADAA